MIYWVVVSTTGQSLLPAITSSCKTIRSLRIKQIIFLREMPDKSAFWRVGGPRLLLKKHTQFHAGLSLFYSTAVLI